jgi:hypothetical protein
VGRDEDLITVAILAITATTRMTANKRDLVMGHPRICGGVIRGWSLGFAVSLVRAVNGENGVLCNSALLRGIIAAAYLKSADASIKRILSFVAQ